MLTHVFSDKHIDSDKRTQDWVTATVEVTLERHLEDLTRVEVHLSGKVIMYADRITESMQKTIDETNRRREKQLAYNEANGITPKQIKKSFSNALLNTTIDKEEVKVNTPKAYVEPETISIAADPVVQYMSKPQMEKAIERIRKQMQEAAKKLEFIEAAQYRDELLHLEDIFKERWG